MGLHCFKRWRRVHILESAPSVTHSTRLVRFNRYARALAMADLGAQAARQLRAGLVSLAIRMAAAELERLFGVYEQFGILVGARFRSAYLNAFELYAPSSKAARRSVFDEPYFAKTTDRPEIEAEEKKT